MKQCGCGCSAFEERGHLLICMKCGDEWMLDDDGNLYDPSDPPGPLWSMSLREYV